MAERLPGKWTRKALTRCIFGVCTEVGLGLGGLLAGCSEGFCGLSEGLNLCGEGREGWAGGVCEEGELAVEGLEVGKDWLLRFGVGGEREGGKAKGGFETREAGFEGGCEGESSFGLGVGGCGCGKQGGNVRYGLGGWCCSGFGSVLGGAVILL